MKLITTLLILVMLAGCSAKSKQNKTSKATTPATTAKKEKKAERPPVPPKRNITQQYAVVTYADSVRKICNQHVLELYAILGKSFTSRQAARVSLAQRVQQLKSAYATEFNNLAKFVFIGEEFDFYQPEFAVTESQKLSKNCVNKVKLSAKNLLDSLAESKLNIAKWRAELVHFTDKYRLLLHTYQLERQEYSRSFLAPKALVDYQVAYYQLLSQLAQLDTQQATPVLAIDLVTVRANFRKLQKARASLNQDFALLERVNRRATNRNPNKLTEKEQEILALERDLLLLIDSGFTLVTDAVERLNSEQISPEQWREVLVKLDTLSSQIEYQMPKHRMTYLSITSNILFSNNKN